MQIVEGLLFLIVLVFLGSLFKYNVLKKLYVSILIGLTSSLLLLHVVLERLTWQLFPLYGAVAIVIGLGLFFVFNITSFQSRRVIRLVTIIVSGVLVLLSGIAEYAFPMYEMLEPNGDFAIGTESFILVDDSREEQYGREGNRRIKIQIWYPAESTDGYDLVPWLEDGEVVAQSLALDTGLPSFVLDHTALIMSNSYKEAPISEALEQYPVVVISHGWRGFRNLHTDLAEELASFGYIVISIDHTYGSVATVFSDDDIAYLNLDALPNRDETTEFIEYANALVNTYAGDITLTINELEKMNTGEIASRFEGKFDLNNIGLLGHSTGGGAGVAVAINDDRIKAIFGLDSWVEPINDEEIDKGLDIPVVFIRSASWEEGLNNTNLLRIVDENLANTRLYQIKGTTHYDFSMAYMYSPLTRNLGMTGELEGEYLVEILTSMMVEFYDQTLKVDNNVGLIIINDNWAELFKIK